MTSTADIPRPEMAGFTVFESVLSDDGKTLYFYKLALGGGLQEKEVVCEKWELIRTALELVQCTKFHISLTEWDIKLLQNKNLDTPDLQLVPSKPISASPNWSDILHSAQLMHQCPSGFRPEADAEDVLSRLLGAYWGCFSHRDNFLIICRRKRLHSPSDDNPVSLREKLKSAGLARQMGWNTPRETYDNELNFSEIGLERSSQAKVFPLPEELADSSEDVSLSDSKGSRGSFQANIFVFRGDPVAFGEDISLSDSESSEGSSQANDLDLESESVVPGGDLSLSLSESLEGSSQANDFDSTCGPAAPGGDASFSDSGKSEWTHSDSDEVSKMQEMQSLSEIGSIESGSSNSWEPSSSFGSTASSSPSRSPMIPNERLRTLEFLSSSGNARHYHEIITHHSKRCDKCERPILRWLHCFECEASDYDVCLPCIDKGRWCLDKSHEMLEADGEGPITMRRFSEWVFTNELRVYDLNSDGTRNCILDFSAGREDLLHESQPALHPSAPIFAWPLSPTKLLLSTFKGDEERVIQRMKSFVKHGRKIDVQVRFSESGSHLFVASIEAVKSKVETQVAYNLHMQVAVLQLRFNGQNLTQPIALCERHHDLRVHLPSNLGTLPFVWTWTAKQVCLTLTTDHISLWRIKFNPSGPARLYLGPVDASTAQLPFQHHDGPFKGHFIFTDEESVPVVALTPSHLRRQSGFPSISLTKADNPWSTRDSEDNTKRADGEVSPPTLVGLQDYETHGRTCIKSEDTSLSTYSMQLSQLRSEIRLLCLLPGSDDDALRCSLTRVSLDDLEMAKLKLMENFPITRQSDGFTVSRPGTEEKRERSPGNKSEETRPAYSDIHFKSRVLGHVDYSRTEDTNMALSDMMIRAASQSATLLKNLKAVTFPHITGNTLAVVGGIMQERDQDRAPIFTNWLHPKYKYEALSYVWGKSFGNHTITMDDKKIVPITDNLYAALRRLRRPDRQRLLWIDAVCINQTDLEERNWQVQMMGRIYSTAARVVIWLGDAEVPVSVFDHESNDESNDEMSENGSKISDDTEPGSEIEWERKTLSHVLESASPPWWTRAWVTQELVQAEDINVAFGGLEVNWSEFRSKFWDTLSSISELEQLIELRRIRRTWHYKGNIGETALITRHTNATDPRDKVYSLLSLVKPAQASLITPNYGLKPAEVFTQATYADLWDSVYGEQIYKESPENFNKEDQFHPHLPKYPVGRGDNQTGLRPDRFRILNWAKSSAPHRLPGMPSWAVDFSDSTVLTEDSEFRDGSERWTFDGNDDLNHRAMLALSEDKRQLTVRGAVLGHIKDIIQEYPVQEYRHRPAGEVIARLLTMLSNLPSETPYKMVSGSQARLRTDELRAIRRPNWIFKESEPGTLVVEQDGVFQKILPHWNPEAEHDTVDWTELHSLALNRGNCDEKGCRCSPSQFFRAWDACVGVPCDTRNFCSGFTMETSPWDSYCKRMKTDEPGEFKDPLREADSRFLLTTSSGFLGLGPGSAEAGDLIALFYGSDIPVVLRADGDHFTYRGRAWINGIMQGELWNIYEDPLLEERDFVIW